MVWYVRISAFQVDLETDSRLGNAIDDEMNSLASGSEGSEQLVQISMSTDIGLQPSDRQVLSVAKRYQVLREGEWWQTIQNQLQEKEITPIEADTAMIEFKLRNVFEATSIVQLEQLELLHVQSNLEVQEEGVFIGKILDQKNQQIKAEWIKRNAKNKNRRGKKKTDSI